MVTQTHHKHNFVGFNTGVSLGHAKFILLKDGVIYTTLADDAESLGIVYFYVYVFEAV